MSSTDPDAELIQELKDVLENTDPTPVGVTEFAKAALGWRRIDAELAELLADTALEESALVRSGESARRLTFRTDKLSIDVEVQVEDGAVRLLGQLAPPLAASVEVQSGDGSVLAAAACDELGRFRIILNQVERIRLRFLPQGEPDPPVETSWIAL